MYDKILIEKICNLSCTKTELDISQESVKYDIDHPFTKYYSLLTIKGAIKKFMSDEWDEKSLANWACIYSWILSGGFHPNVTEEFDSLEKFFKETIVWFLDGLSFIDGSPNPKKGMSEMLDFYENYDRIWQARDEWKAVYAMIGPFARHNGSQYIVFVNDIAKEYMIMYSEHLKNGFEDEHFKFVKQKAHVALVKRLKDNGYRMIACDEDEYYKDLDKR